MDLNRGSARSGDSAPASHAGGGSRSGGAKSLLIILLIILALLGIGFGAARIYGTVAADNAVKGKQYQALFLTNGQVYFGHLAQTSSGYVKLTDIYYLQVQQQVQPKDQSQQQQPQISLAKLGGELHGPEDVMYVNHDQVLFWENLKDDGKVVQAIKNFQSSNKK